jgi:UDP-2,3-diacylglucosamine pyrophosphatase LpxH
MSYSNRLERAYRASSEICINDKSKLVLLSDCHRGDGSWSDDFAGNRNLFYYALETYYKDNFTYIELGDGDELWENRSLSAIMRENEDLFELMSRFHNDDRLYLLYGNHDLARSEKDVEHSPYFASETFSRLFPGIAFHEGLILNYYGGEIFLLHGHQADFFNSVLWKLGRFLVRNLWKRLENLGVNDPTSASKNPKKKSSVELKLMKWAKEKGLMLIAGHTHRAVFPKPGKGLYFNDGSCVFRDHISAIEIEDGSISLVNWSFKVRDDGTLYAGRGKIDTAMLKDYFVSIK